MSELTECQKVAVAKARIYGILETVEEMVLLAKELAEEANINDEFRINVDSNYSAKEITWYSSLGTC